MTVNGLFKAAKEHALEHTVVIDSQQKRPNTFVRVCCNWERDLRKYLREYFDFGFSKCQWPDKWDADYGVEMARKKAAADIARSLVRDGWQPAAQE